MSNDPTEPVNPAEGDPIDDLGSVDGSEAAADAPAAEAAADAVASPAGADVAEGEVAAEESEATGPEAEIAAAKAEAAERTEDLKRLQAEYVNYKRRVDRDRDLHKEMGIEKVLLDMLPILDSLRAAEEHEELTGGFKLVGEEIVKVTKRYGLEEYGEKDDPFDPQIHEALMQVPTPGATEPVCLDVMRVGYRRGSKVLRAARVAVAMPADETSED